MVRGAYGTVTGLFGQICWVKMWVVWRLWLWTILFISNNFSEVVWICHTPQTQ